jgi:leukemia factor-related protein
VFEDGEGEEGGMGNFTSTVCVNFSEDDLRLATIPGQDFDPTTRRFSEEELKPQPIIRKRKKQFVPDELKNNKYWAKRYKNNEAAKRSREARRLKENQIAMRARFLEEENNALKGEVDVLKKENSDLKQMMMALEEKFNKFSNTC